MNAEQLVTVLGGQGAMLLASIVYLNFRLKRLEDDMTYIMNQFGLVRERVARLEGREDTNPGVGRV